MNIADVKRELSGDEKVLESAFKLETIYKKYKILIWAVIIGSVLFFVGKTAMQSIHETKLQEANNAFLSLQKNEKDSNALATLKEKNPMLFELYSYAQANKNKDVTALKSLAQSKNSIIADASAYSAATLANKTVDSKLYKDFVLVEEAYSAIKSGDAKSAKSKLSLIDERSPLAKVASFLKHSTIKAK